MLYKSGYNLKQGLIEFISNSNEITLYSAYIKTKQLEQINFNKSIKRIVVRWDIRDLHQGSSDLDLYYYCQRNGIELYRNTRIHLKCLKNERNELFLGSANITTYGIGDNENYNLELNTNSVLSTINDTLYLNKIIASSTFVSEEFFTLIEKQVLELGEYDNKIYKIEETPQELTSDNFLLSALPMSDTPVSLINSIIQEDLYDIHMLHDLTTYNIDPLNDFDILYQALKSSFNKHPFIISIKDAIKNSAYKSMRYGSMVEWIINNTTTVPTPRSWEIKKEEIVNILYDWICYFDDNYFWEIPGSRSQVIFYKPQISIEVENFIENLRRDERHEIKAPHQLILLESIFQLINPQKNSFSIEELNLKFTYLWNQNIYLLKSSNCNIGMPLKALYNQGLISIRFFQGINCISDFRNYKRIETEISSIIISKRLINLFHKCEKGTFLKHLSQEFNT